MNDACTSRGVSFLVVVLFFATVFFAAFVVTFLEAFLAVDFLAVFLAGIVWCTSFRLFGLWSCYLLGFRLMCVLTLACIFLCCQLSFLLYEFA